MREGLENIMTTLSPLTSSEWETVMNDVRRLLHVWESKETDAVARSVVLQIEDMLKEFSQPSKVSPKLLISESSRIPVISHTVAHSAITHPVISHVVDHSPEECDSDADADAEAEAEAEAGDRAGAEAVREANSINLVGSGRKGDAGRTLD
jgi:hypothetical protein